MSDPYDAARPHYEAELAAGTERFLEPRRGTCPWCGSTDLSVRLRSSELVQRKPGSFTLERCGTCSHIFQNPRLTPAGLDFYYRDYYDGLGQEMIEKAFNASGRSYRGRIDMLKPFTTPMAWLVPAMATSAGSPARSGRTAPSTGSIRASALRKRNAAAGSTTDIGESSSHSPAS